MYLLPLPHGVALTQLVPLTYYAGEHPTTRLSDTGHAGFALNVTVDVWSASAVAVAEVSAVGSWPGARPVAQSVALKAGSNSVMVYMRPQETKAVRLWHPHGHGEQPLYNVTATVRVAPSFGTGAAAAAASPTVAVASRRIGFRHVALVTINDTDPATAAAAKSQEGTGSFTMMFRVNGAAVYARGGAMVPMDLLNGRLSAEAHRRVVQSAAEGNMNTLRICASCEQCGLANSARHVTRSASVRHASSVWTCEQCVAMRAVCGHASSVWPCEQCVDMRAVCGHASSVWTCEQCVCCVVPALAALAARDVLIRCMITLYRVALLAFSRGRRGLHATGLL